MLAIVDLTTPEFRGRWSGCISQPIRMSPSKASLESHKICSADKLGRSSDYADHCDPEGYAEKKRHQDAASTVQLVEVRWCVHGDIVRLCVHGEIVAMAG